MNDRAVKFRLILLSFLQYAAWGAYLPSLGRFLTGAGLGSYIKWIFAAQSISALFMPALVGSLADRRFQKQRLLSLCHFISGALMLVSGLYCTLCADFGIGLLFVLLAVSMAVYIPTISLSNSVSFQVIVRAGGDTVRDFPSIRMFGTLGFVISMLATNFLSVDGVRFQNSGMQLVLSGVLSLILAAYALSLPQCLPDVDVQPGKSDAKPLFSLLRGQVGLFFLFSVFIGAVMKIGDGYANAFMGSFASDPIYADTFAVKNSNALLAVSQMSETFCILLIPFCMKRFGIKKVMLISMAAWILRFLLFGLGTPAMPGVLLFVLSCLVYGVAFDFFNISGSLFIEKNVGSDMRARAQGAFILMTNGLGALIGTLAAGFVMDALVYKTDVPDWSMAWFIFAGYVAVLAVVFAVFFKEPGSE